MKKLMTVLALFCITIGGYSQVTPETALKAYLDNGDNSFAWELKDTYDIDGVKAYDLLLTSQNWKEHLWKHQLTILVPKENKFDGALLYITGGSIKDGEPRWSNKDDKFNKSVSAIATANKALVAVVKQVPNQPLYGGKTEDELISMTLHNFKQDNDYTWPLLFPMVKSAVKAMDAIQQFSKQQLSHTVNRFVISGASKRGWTTWLTGASDKRAEAIAPMVIDILNMPVSLDYQIKALGGYSVQIEDYVRLGIPQGAKTESGMAVSTMVDPYAYRAALTMPKLLFMGTNDEYWVVDNVKNYLSDIPGKNLLHYVPNAGHNLGDGKQALEALSAFFGSTLTHTPYPDAEWKTSVKKKMVNVAVKTSKDELVDVILWHADSEDTDFRNDKWTSRSLGISGKKSIAVQQALPTAGYRAFYIDLKYKAVNGGTYTVSTRVFMTDTNKIL